MKIFRALWGFLLIFFGIILLLNTAYGLSWGIWLFLWQFWPIILILFGIGFFLQWRRIPFFGGLIILTIIFTFFGSSIFWSWQDDFFDSDRWAIRDQGVATEEKVSNEYPKGIESVKVKLNSGASTVRFESSDSDSNLYAGTHLSNFFNLNQSLHINGKTAEVTLKVSPILKTIFGSKNLNELTLAFSTKPEYEFDINTGASVLDLNLERLKVRDIQIDGGATKMTVRLGNQLDLNGEIEAGASSIKLQVPKGIGLRIKSNSAFVSNNFADFGLRQSDSTWQNDAWDQEDNKKIDLNINAGASNVEIAEY